MSRPVRRSMTCGTAHITGTIPTISVRINGRLSNAAATTPNANATATVVRTKTTLMVPTSLAALKFPDGMPGGRSHAQLEAIVVSLRSHPSEKREILPGAAARLEPLPPEEFRLLVRTIRVTRRTGHIAGAASMHDHRVVPRAETVSEIAGFTCADGIRN